MTGLKAKFVINVAGALVSIAIALVTVPMYVSHIGEDRYGILSLVWVMLGYLGFLDFGLSRATANALAKLHDAPAKERGSVFMTALWVNILLGSVGGLIIYFAGGPILLATHGLSDTLRAEVKDIIVWIAPVLPLSLASGVSIGALEAREKFLAANILQISSTALGQVVPLLVAIFVSPSLTTVIPATFCVRALTTVVTLVIVISGEKLHRFNLFDMKRAKSLLGYGIWVTLTNFLISPFLTSIDQFVIGNMIGASFVARYSVPMSAASRLQIFNSSLSRTVFPRFSRLAPAEAAALAAKGMVSLAYLSAMLFAPALVVVHPFFDLWMGKAFAAYSAPVAAVLFVGAWVNGLAFIPYSLLQGQGRPDKVAKLHTAEVLPYLGVLWLLVQQVGLVGAAITWALRVTIDAVVMSWMARLRTRALLPAAPALIGTLLGLGLGRIAPGWPPLLMLAAASALALGIGATGLLIVPDLRTMTMKVWNALSRRVAAP